MQLMVTEFVDLAIAVPPIVKAPILVECSKGIYLPTRAMFLGQLSLITREQRLINDQSSWSMIMIATITLDLDLDLSRFLQVYCRISLQDSRSFVGDPPHLTLNHGFPVIRLS